MIVKIVYLSSLRAISFRSNGSDSPEKTTWQKLSSFIINNNLSVNPTCFQVFGRNNPIALNNPQNRGYEYLLTVPNDFVLENNMEEFILQEGLFAVVTSKGIEQMQENWMNLVSWIKQNKEFTFGYPENYDYENSPSLELEHHVDPLNCDEKSILVDYYFPIIKRSEDEH